jgi:hypothetical protein
MSATQPAAMKDLAAAFALLASLIAPAAAQAPPPVPALPDAPRLTQYSVSASTCACSVGFALYADGTDIDNWIQVFIGSTPVLSTDPVNGWKLTSPTGSLGNIPRPITDAVLTFNSAQTGAVTIVGARRPRRVSQFSENRGVPARDLNQAITGEIAILRESWDKLQGATVGQPGESLQRLPPAATRAGTILNFNSSGQPIVSAPGAGTGNVVGPAGATNNDFVCFNGATGGVIRDCGSFPIINVTQYGAKCNGSTNDTAAFNAAIMAASTSAAGGGLVQIPAGTCIISGVFIPSKVILQGAGRGVTTLQGPAGVNGNIIVSQNFATLTGTNTAGGPNEFGLRDFTIDGNKTNRTAGDNIDIYGYSYEISRVDSVNSPGIGLYSEWAVPGQCPIPTLCMEARITDFRSAWNNGDGIDWFGSHDSTLLDVTSFLNSGYGLFADTNAVHNGSGTILTNIDSYTNSKWGILTTSSLFGSNVTAGGNALGGIQVNGAANVKFDRVDVYFNTGPAVQLNSAGSLITNLFTTQNTGSSGYGLQVLANENQVIGYTANGNSQCALQIGGTLNSINGLMSLINGCSVDFTVDSGGNSILGATNFQTSGASYFGTPPATDRIELTTTGGATGVDIHQIVGHQADAGPTPTVSSCGTGASNSGTDNAGFISTGTTATSTCTLTFATAYVNKPYCTVSPATSNGVGVYASTSPTLLFLTFPSATAAQFSYYCRAQKGG